MIIHHIDMVILDIDMGYGLMIWEMTVSIWSSWISMWDILSLCSVPVDPYTLAASSFPGVPFSAQLTLELYSSRVVLLLLFTD